MAYLCYPLVLLLSSSSSLLLLNSRDRLIANDDPAVLFQSAVSLSRAHAQCKTVEHIDVLIGLLGTKGTLYYLGYTFPYKGKWGFDAAFAKLLWPLASVYV